MTSTTSESRLLGQIVIGAVAVAVLAATFALVGCEDNPQPTVNNKTRIVTAPTTSTQAETQEPPKPSPQNARTAPADNSDDDKPRKEAPFFGSTYWDELLTSVYYYPEYSPAMTHLKFNHREDDIWICGDQRRSFEAGNRYRLLVTFEPNQPCVTNWKIK